MQNQYKTQLRKTLRKKRRDLSQSQQQQAGEQLAKQLQALGAVVNAQHIAIYLANDGEIDTSAFIKWCWHRQKHVYMPIVRQHDGANTLLFAPLQQETTLIYNHYGIAEPDVPESSYITARDLELVLMPLVGFDESGSRIGMGGGFYDQTFAFKRHNLDMPPRLIGLAHECQKVEKIETENWDIPLSMVVTDNKAYLTC